MASRDLYEVLGVSRTASADEIRAAYRKLARELHPDVNPGDAAAEERFKQVSAAYGVLSDAEKRSLYDEFGDVALQAGFDRQQAEQLRRFGGGTPFDFRSWSQAFGGGGGGGLEELLGSLLGGLGGRRGGPRRGESLRTELSIDLPLAVRGGRATLRLDLPGREEVDVRIPPGIEDGQTMRLNGLGRPGPGGGPAGDLLVEVRVLPHPVYRREGDDLYVDVPVTLAEAISGGEVRFGGPTGEVGVRLPPGTQSGQSFRLRGLGVGGRGNLYARMLVTAPRVPADAPPQVRERLARIAEELRGYYPDDPRVQVRF